MQRLALGIVGGVAHEDRHVPVGQALLQTFHDRHGEPAEAVGRNHSDGQALAAMQALGEHVRPEAEFASGGDNPIAGLLTQAAAIVERLRCRADADASMARHVADGQPEPPSVCDGARRFMSAAEPIAFRHRPTLLYFTAPLRKPDM